MADIILDRQTYILISDTLNGLNVGLYPSNDIYPSDDQSTALYPTEVVSVESNIVEGSMSLEEMIADGDIDLGKLYSTKFECDLFNIEQELQGKFIQVYQTSDEYEGNIPVFLGYIDSCTSDRLGTDYHIIAYDLAYYYGGMDISAIWNRYMSTTTQITTTYGKFPYVQAGSGQTPSMIRIDWCEFLELVFDELGIVHDIDFNLILDISGYARITTSTSVDLYVNSKVQKMPLSDLIMSICQLAEVIPHWGSDGIFRVVELSTNSSALENAVDLTDNYEKENLNISQLVHPPFDNVEYKHNLYTDANYVKTTYSQTVNSNENKYNMTNNILLLLTGCIYGTVQVQRSGIGGSYDFDNSYIISNIYNYLHNLNYYVGSISLIISSTEDLIGKLVKVDLNENDTIYFPVLKSSYDGTQFINQTVSAEGTIPTAEDASPVNYSGESTQTQVDTLTENVTELSTKTEYLGNTSWQDIANNESVAHDTKVKVGEFSLDKGVYIVDLVGAFSHTGTTDGSGYREMYIAQGSSTGAMGYIQLERRAPISSSDTETIVRISCSFAPTATTTYSVYMKQVNGQSVSLTGNVRAQILRIR